MVPFFRGVIISGHTSEVFDRNQRIVRNLGYKWKVHTYDTRWRNFFPRVFINSTVYFVLCKYDVMIICTCFYSKLTYLTSLAWRVPGKIILFLGHVYKNKYMILQSKKFVLIKMIIKNTVVCSTWQESQSASTGTIINE